MAGDNDLYIGIDLGTFRSVLTSSAGHEEEVLTVVGTPKDPIARNMLGKDVLFGEEALKNRLALNLYRPLEHGVIKDTAEDKKFIAHFINHLIALADPEEYDNVVAVIGAPAEASFTDQTAIFDAERTQGCYFGLGRAPEGALTHTPTHPRPHPTTNKQTNNK